jgi:hypothetical protein
MTRVGYRVEGDRAGWHCVNLNRELLCARITVEPIVPVVRSTGTWMERSPECSVVITLRTLLSIV